MGKAKRMDQIKIILETYAACRSIKGTARRLQISKNTVRQYVRQHLNSSSDLAEGEDHGVAGKQLRSFSAHREWVFEQQVKGWLSELRRVGVTRQLLWEEYKAEHPDGYGYSQFCELLKRHIQRSDLSIAIDHEAGAVMQVDFAGKKLSWVDIASGEVHQCEVLVAVLPHSQYTFVIALPSQKVVDFIHGLNQALLYFGKLPKIILSDNLKSYVTKADRYDPDFNELCVQLAAFYQIDLDATRVGKPKDKASVENAVRTAYSRIYAPLRDQIFHSPEQLNEAIYAQLNTHNNLPFQKKAGSRKALFEEYEAPQMRDLPSDLFEVRKTVEAKVQRNYHVFLGEEKNYYSVPFQHASQQATVIYHSKAVEIFIGSNRVAVHSRLASYNQYRYQTDAQHLPKNHQEWRKAQGFDAAYFLSASEKIGSATNWAVSQVLLSKIHEVQTYKSCQGILQLAKKYTAQRLEQAALRCQKAGKATYGMLKRILEAGLDQPSATPDRFTPPAHDNIRGPEAYQ